jgi:hypothetical protein
MAKKKPQPSELPICFVVSPIGEPGSPTRRRSDQVLKHIIRPAAEAAGFRTIRADELNESGLISTQIIQHIVNDPIVVADLTDSNANVFYELAMRHAIAKPCVMIIDQGQRLPFDVAGMRAVQFDHKDLDSALDAKTSLTNQIIAAVKPDAPVETPFTVAVQLDTLKGSTDPTQRTLAELVAGLNALRTTVERLDQSGRPRRFSELERDLAMREAMILERELESIAAAMAQMGDAPDDQTKSRRALLAARAAVLKERIAAARSRAE